MHLNGLLRGLALLLLSSGAVSLPHQDSRNDLMHSRRHLMARQAPVSNTTRPASTRASSTQPLITPDPRTSTRVSSTWTTIGTSSSAPTTQTISGGEIVVAVIGATYVAGAGGGSLVVAGVTHALAPGAVVSIIGTGANGDTPEIENISNPAPSQNPQTSDPAESKPPSSAPSVPSSTSAAPTSTSATSSSTPSSTAVPTPYIILTSQNSTKEEIQDLNSTLSRDAAPRSLEEVISDRTGLVAMFKANITTEQANAMSKRPGVAGVTPDERLEEEQPPSSSAPPSSASRQPTATGPPGSPKTSVPNPSDIALQSDAVDELKAISQPAGASIADLPGFGYASEAGKGVTIYVIDTGANAENSEWTGMTGTKGFMYAPGATKDETDFLNHGSCVASKAAGPAYGTAKGADLIAVKLPGTLSLSAIFTALIEISNDVFQKKLEGKAVINMSLGSRIPDKLSSTTTAYKLLLVALMAEDIVIVTASGNDAQYGVDDVTEYPALFGPTTDIIVVGATENDGYRAFFSQGTGDQLTVSAPGFVDCASGRSAGSQELYGTSFAHITNTQSEAAPAVAGVIAVWLSQDEHKARLQVPGSVATNVKEMVKSLAYSRVEGEPAVIWNGIDPRGLACSAPGSSAGRRRQAAPSGGAGSCQATSVASAAPTSTSAPEAPTSTSGLAPTSAAPSSSTSAQPSPPPKPTWSDAPQGFTKVLERDGVASADYDATSDSASEGVTSGIEQWCLSKCTDQCASVFLYRVLQFNRGAYNPYYICNRYNKVWSDTFIQTGISSSDAGVAFNKV
ncbi:alkaline proteinase [Colletotrichum scovillei]|uniref:Alkaline proteinase n=1 Tax=Colletotrichum scovillei TaxID=1209932 RepID=A0A9P7UIH0_9PEZI|nr:alkaline proteinase [Colletotrichum scovillei]KAG7077925.1 alkaline proteinase [Colletotrichum scovillei]KAG7085054.1 alkaline proteinase [Colletotrichum scovillei]